jgi:hypothetical protein
MRYLHAQALPVRNQLATIMLNHGGFNFIPNARLAALLQGA